MFRRLPFVAAAVFVSACPGRPSRIRIEPQRVVLSAAGERVHLAAVAVDPQGSAMRGTAMIFESRNPAVATVDPEGWVTAVKSGRALIEVSGGGASGSLEVMVGIPASLAIKPQALTLVGIGSKGDLTAQVSDENGSLVPDQGVAWSSADSHVATVAAGQLTSTGLGRTEIAAVSGSLRAVATVDVGEPPFESVRIDPQRVVVRAGEQVAVPAKAFDAQGAVVSGVALEWSTEDSDVATVDANGTVHGVERGRTRLLVSAGHVRSSVDVEVLAPRKGR